MLPRHYDPTDLANITADEMRLAIFRIQRITCTPVVMSSLVGIRLVSYSPPYSDILFGLQPIIDAAINQLNYLISGMNRLNNLRTVDLSSHVHRCVGRGGRYRTRYLHLYDGVHPGPRLLEIWAYRILDYCAHMFPYLTHIRIEFMILATDIKCGMHAVWKPYMLHKDCGMNFYWESPTFYGKTHSIYVFATDTTLEY